MLSIFTGISRCTVKSISIRVESPGSMRTVLTLPAFIPAYRTIAPGNRPPADLKYVWYGVPPEEKVPATAKTVPISSAAAIQTKRPTAASSRLPFIASSFSVAPPVALGTKEEFQASAHPRVRQFLDRVYLQMLTGDRKTKKN
jgi:hypothetical protein